MTSKILILYSIYIFFSITVSSFAISEWSCTQFNANVFVLFVGKYMSNKGVKLKKKYLLPIFCIYTVEFLLRMTQNLVQEFEYRIFGQPFNFTYSASLSLNISTVRTTEALLDHNSTNNGVSELYNS